MRLCAALWEATRPRMFPVWLSSGLVPAAIAWRDGVFDPAVFVLETLLCFCLLTLSCWADELGDLDHGVDNEDRLGPIRPLQRGDVSSREMKAACAVLAAVCVAVGAALLAWSFWQSSDSIVSLLVLVLVGCCFVPLAFGYTMGNKPYGYRGLGDLVAFACFGPVACGVGYWLFSHSMNWAVLLPASSVGLLLAATINLQNIRDVENDAACGKITLAFKLGKRGSSCYQVALVLCACVCYLTFLPLVGLSGFWSVCVLVVACAPLVSHCLRFARMVAAGSDYASFDDLMWPLTRGMLVACLAFCAVVVL